MNLLPAQSCFQRLGCEGDFPKPRFSGGAGPLPGYGGWFDFNNAINAMKRKDGEYILFAGDDGAQKVNMFRWKP